MRMRAPMLAMLLLAACSSSAVPPPLAGVRLERLLPQVEFANPLFLTHAPGEPGRLYVATQGGQVFGFAAGDAAAQPFLDLRDRVTQRGGEEGLLGLAFHPDYAKQRWVYAYYTPAKAPRRSVIARYPVRDRRADPAAEQVLLEFEQPYSNHNGGMIAFGPDGMLYVGSGDGGSGGDPHGNGQRLDTLLGKILRLTPEGAPAPGNPFAGRAGARAEIWAYGLRNPWRFSFDRKTGELWAGDVGQNRWEEIDLVVRGGNYGWRRHEGTEVYDEDTPAPGAIAPIVVYGRNLGVSVTGGYVYRGRAIPALAGAYLYGDFGSGRIWALRHDGRQVTGVAQVLQAQALSSFGEDADGELYICSFDGGIYKLVPASTGASGGPGPAP